LDAHGPISFLDEARLLKFPPHAGLGMERRLRLAMHHRIEKFGMCVSVRRSSGARLWVRTRPHRRNTVLIFDNTILPPLFIIERELYFGHDLI
jgi:hypothetical protein